MFKLVLISLLSIFAYANSSSNNLTNQLSLEKGEIKAHTEIFGDSKINPQTKMIDANFTLDDKIESLQGTMSIKTLSLKSDNTKRDEHMHELLQAHLYPKISFKIIQTQVYEDKYLIDGLLTLNGVTKPISSICTIQNENSIITLEGYFGIKLTTFNMEPPSMLFLTVRDKIDINYKFTFKKEK